MHDTTRIVLSEALAHAHEGAQVCAAAAVYTCDNGLRNELEEAARDQRALVTMLEHALNPEDTPVQEIANTATATLAAATCARLGDASIASTVLPVERLIRAACQHAQVQPGLSEQLREALCWAADKSARRIEAFERRSLVH